MLLTSVGALSILMYPPCFCHILLLLLSLCLRDDSRGALCCGFTTSPLCSCHSACRKVLYKFAVHSHPLSSHAPAAYQLHTCAWHMFGFECWSSWLQ